MLFRALSARFCIQIPRHFGLGIVGSQVDDPFSLHNTQRGLAAIKTGCPLQLKSQVIDLDPLGNVLVAIAIAVGLVGIVVAAIPGLILIWAAVLVWALVEQTVTGWFVLGLATVLTVIGQIVKYVIPGRHLREAGIPRRSVLAGAVLSIVGFFVIPIVGFIIGFVLGVYLSERYRLGTHIRAWPSTKQAMRAAGLSILIELVAGLGIAGSWAISVILL